MSLRSNKTNVSMMPTRSVLFKMSRDYTDHFIVLYGSGMIPFKPFRQAYQFDHL